MTQAQPIRSAGGKADLLLGDLADADNVRATARQATELSGGHVDILVNNAAVYPARGLTADTTHDDFINCYAVNVQAPFLLVAELCPAMATRGHGNVVNVLSMAARFGMPGSQPPPPPDDPPHPRRSPPRSPTSPATTPASSTAPSSTSTAAATRPEIHPAPRRTMGRAFPDGLSGFRAVSIRAPPGQLPRRSVV
jgi:NAD(P)-dependent dehydrogenase (short-subunit alcohol dehydrogenase family)